MTHCRKWPPAGSYVRAVARKELQGHPMCQEDTGWGANGWSWEGPWPLAPRLRPLLEGERQPRGLCFLGWWCKKGFFAQCAGQRLQGTQGALHTHLGMSGAGRRQRTLSTQPAPGPPQKSSLEIIFVVEKKQMRRNCSFKGGGDGGRFQRCCRWRGT